MKKTILLLLCYLSLQAQAQQDRHIIDSLLQKAATVKPRQKVYAYDEIALRFYRNHTDSAIKYTRLTLHWALKLNDSLNIPYAYTFLGVLYKNKGSFDTSLQYYFKSIRYQQDNGFEKGVAGNYNNIATIYKLKGRYDQAILYYHRSLKIFTAAKDYELMNTVVQNLAELYLAMQREDKAMEELKKAEMFYAKHPKPSAMAYLYQGFGEIYLREKNYTAAGNYLKKSIALFANESRKTDLVKAQIILAKVYMDKREIRSCDSVIRKIESNFNVIPSGYDSVEVMLLEAKLALEQKHFGKTISRSSQAIETAQRIEAGALLIQANQLLSQAYERMGNNAKALHYFKQYKYLEDSVSGLEKQKAVAELEARYEVSEKESQINRLRDSSRIALLENSRTYLQLQNQKTRNTFLWVLAGMILLSSVIFYIRFRQKRSLSKQLQSSLSERELLIREIHHRVKNNLQIISSLLNLQMNREHEGNVNTVIQLSQDRIHTMAMIHEKLYQSANLENISIEEYVTGMCDYYRISYGLDEKKIAISCEVQSPNIHIDQLIPMGLILNELIINSIKYAFASEGGNIAISCVYVDGLITFMVRDNGRGLPDDYKSRMKKSLGIQLVQGLSKQLKGVPEIENDRGAKFVLRFKPKF